MRPFEIDWWPNRVVAGRGTVSRLREMTTSLGRRHAMVICGKSVASSDLLRKVKDALGDLLVGVFPHIEMHAPIPNVSRATAYAHEVKADLIISLGGGSAIDSAKGVRLMRCVGEDFLEYALKGVGQPSRPMPQLDLAHIAIPTTAGSGSEVTPTCGFRDPEAGHKRIFRNESLIPDIAILDPEMVLEAPETLTACSGMTAVARCVEALYSGRRNPFRTALALHGLRMLTKSLPQSIRSLRDVDARAECLAASAMSAVAANVNTSAVHAVGHVVGGEYGLQHGVPHTILLASGARMMLPLIGEEQKTLLLTLGESAGSLTADEAGGRVADLLANFASLLPLPNRLRDVGVERGSLDRLAERASRDPILMSSGAGLSAERIRTMLEQAY